MMGIPIKMIVEDIEASGRMQAGMILAMTKTVGKTRRTRQTMTIVPPPDRILHRVGNDVHRVSRGICCNTRVGPPLSVVALVLVQ
jgi:hypothetical protein